MEKRVLTFGEVMLRLKAPYGEMILQSPMFEASFGGCEANVAVSLANYGHRVDYVTCLPDNGITDSFVATMRSFGVGTDSIRRGDGRFGVYFVEPGAMQRPSKVIYDRSWSAVSLAGPEAYDWPEIVKDARWLHLSGITPAVSRTAADAVIAAAKAASEAGVTVSLDLNYRAKLWNYGESAQSVMAEIMPYVTVCIGNEEDSQKMLGIDTEHIQADEAAAGEGDLGSGAALYARYRKIAEAVLERYPKLSHVAISLRDSVNADVNAWSGCLTSRSGFHVGPRYELTDIVDRVGGGDSFSAGILHGLMKGDDEQFTIDFAVSASCLKHSILGDFNRVKESDVLSLMKSGGRGRIQR